MLLLRTVDVEFMKFPNVVGISVEISVVVGIKLDVKMESIVGTSWVVVV